MGLLKDAVIRDDAETEIILVNSYENLSKSTCTCVIFAPPI